MQLLISNVLRARSAIYCAIAARHYNKMTINRSIAERETEREKPGDNTSACAEYTFD